MLGFNTVVKSKPEDLTLGEQLDSGIASLEARLAEMKRERGSLSPELLAMKRSQLYRLSTRCFEIESDA